MGSSQVQDRMSSVPRSAAPRVLVIEDAQDSRELFAQELEAAGFLAFCAEDGESGIQPRRDQCRTIS